LSMAPLLGGLFCSAAFVAAFFSRVRDRGRRLPDNLKPGNRDHSPPLFVGQSQRECTLIAEPVVLDAVGGQASSRGRSRFRPFKRRRFDQEKLALA